MTEIDPIENALASALAPDGEVLAGDADRLQTLIDSVLQTPMPAPPTSTAVSKGILAGAGAMAVGAALFFFLRKPEPPPVAHSESPPVVTVMPSAPTTTTAEVPAMSIDTLPVAPTATTSTVRLPDATELFARANEARRKSRDDDAIAGYRTLQQTFPSSEEAQASHVALGRLLLDKRADYDGALSQFDAYLASPNPGVLEEEALIGRALALQHLGRAADERRAWQLLLDKYPDSIYAEKARARLAH